MKNVIYFMLALLVAQHALAEAIIRLVPGQSEDDVRHVYPHKILRLSLDATIESDGPYKVMYSSDSYTRNRALIELQSGENINVHAAPTRDEWEKQAIPVYIPIRKGLLGYRLLLINKSEASVFKEIKSQEELKQLYAGLGAQWSVTRAMDALQFNIVTGNNYEGLFTMLEAGRFDYFPRGINEIFQELELRKSKYPSMIVEPTLAIYIPMPTYFFVSPAYPELADRIGRGMNAIIEDGTFDRAFNHEFGVYINSANLGKRKVFKFNNPLTSAETPSSIERYWFQY